MGRLINTTSMTTDSVIDVGPPNPRGRRDPPLAPLFPRVDAPWRGRSSVAVESSLQTQRSWPRRKLEKRPSSAEVDLETVTREQRIGPTTFPGPNPYQLSAHVTSKVPSATETASADPPTKA
jgi:hypothetical protein